MAEEQKKQTGKKRNYKGKFNFYEVKGETVERKNKVCPKCGPGAFLAIHKDRLSCGGCGYTEPTGAAPAENRAECSGQEAVGDKEPQTPNPKPQTSEKEAPKEEKKEPEEKKE
jgi:small subunit ribosomal protein S27Ae